MSIIKRHLHAYDDEVGGDTPTLEELMEWMDLNAELFSRLPSSKIDEAIDDEE